MKKGLPEIVLASASPRRAEMLARLGINFTVRAVDLDETPRPGEVPEEYTLRLAEEKGSALEREAGEIIISADTSVVVQGQILGKPENSQDAIRMLRMLSGRSHRVLSAVALRRDTTISDLCSTEVKFREMSEEEIDWYVSTGEPLDKAGAYGIQGFASLFIDGIKGSYSNVVGLPIQLLEVLFTKQNLEMRDFINF